MKILMIEAEDTILQDVVTFLSEKTSCHVRNLSLTTDSLNVLTFSSLEIHLQEQMVIHNGDHIPLSSGDNYIVLKGEDFSGTLTLTVE